jgi:hypothetical protein
MGGNPSQADKLDQSPASENQEKIVDIYFGVFFDAMDTSFAAHYFNRDEYLRKGEEAVSDVKDSSIYKGIDEYSGYAGSIANQLPNNPVSNYVNKALEAKKTIENKADDLIGKVGEVSDKIAGLQDKAPEIPTHFGTEKEEKEEKEDDDSLLGSRSIISKLQPCYAGDILGTYNFRIYVTGAVTHKEVRRKKPANPDEPPELSEEFKNQLEKEAIDAAMEAVKQKIPTSLPKINVHFDVFGYEKDPAVKNFIPELDKFKQEPNVLDLSIDFKGFYENFYDTNEVIGSMGGDTKIRFRNLNKL